MFNELNISQCSELETDFLGLPNLPGTMFPKMFESRNAKNSYVKIFFVSLTGGEKVRIFNCQLTLYWPLL